MIIKTNSNLKTEISLKLKKKQENLEVHKKILIHYYIFHLIKKKMNVKI